MLPDPWISEEPRALPTGRWALARTCRRPWLVLAVTSLVSGAIIARRALKAPSYEASLYLRLTEGALSDPTNSLPLPSDIRQHIASAALSRQKLEEIMRAHRISSTWLARDPVAAIQDFRESIGIDVQRNYFIYGRGRDGPPRSAEVRLSLAGTDPDQTRAILHELGDAVLRDQDAQRHGRLAALHEHFRNQVELARQKTRGLQDDIRRQRVELDRADASRAVAIRAQIGALDAEVTSAIEQELALERRATGAEFSGAVEGRRLGVSFDVIDEYVNVLSPHLTGVQLALRGSAVFALVLTISAATIGVFDQRVHAPEDLSRCDVPLLGSLPRFDGDDVDPYEARPGIGPRLTT